MRIAHLTSVHSRNDTRIFLKMCRSIVATGHEAVLIVADGKGGGYIDGVEVIDVGGSSSRLSRMTLSAFRVFRAAMQLRSDIYHVHDPELIPFGLLLRLSGRTVLFDAHEDLPKQILSKPYLPAFVARVLSSWFGVFERLTIPLLSGVIAATPSIGEKFVRMHSRVVTVNNFPLLSELAPAEGWTEKFNEVAYVGVLTRIRGAVQLVGAMSECKTRARLNFAGGVSGSGLQSELQASNGWDSVIAHGQLNRDGVRALLGRSVAGLVTFLPAPNHLDAQPNKMFEYMSAGIPVIASNFPMWRAIVDESQCGICVSPTSPAEIAAAIDTVVSDPELAKAMGERGRMAVLSRYNWGREELVLLDFYSLLMAENQR